MTLKNETPSDWRTEKVKNWQYLLAFALLIFICFFDDFMKFIGL